MPLTPLPGAATLTVKVSDFNAFITALNAELAALEAKIRDLGVATSSFDLALEERFNTRIADHDHDDMQLQALAARVGTLEDEADPVIPPDLTDRVEALENMIRRVPSENPQQLMGVAPNLGPPENLNPDEITMVYEQVTLYYHDLEMHAQRIAENRWRLVSTLNYIVVSPAVWTYDEIIEGTADDVYAHAVRRLHELAELKPQHDEVHARVKAMSEGEE